MVLESARRLGSSPRRDALDKDARRARRGACGQDSWERAATSAAGALPHPYPLVTEVVKEARDDEAVTWGEIRALESRLLRRLLAETGARVQGLIEDQVAEDLDIYNAHGAALCEQTRDARSFCARNTRMRVWCVPGWPPHSAEDTAPHFTHTPIHDSDGDDGQP